LNARPKLRRVLKQEIGEYKNIQIEWIRGETPRAFFRDSEGKTVKEAELTDVEHAGFLDLLKAHGFVPTLKEVKFDERPTANGLYNGHYYEYYETLTPFELAKKFATNKTAAYLVTITSKEEENFIISLIPESARSQHVGIWLGGQDVNEEGKWEWMDGPEKGVVFWQGPRAAGEKVEGQYANWIKNEPNNAIGESFQEDCAVLKVQPEKHDSNENGKWMDVTCFPVSDQFRATVLEYDSQPLSANQNQIVIQEKQDLQQQQAPEPIKKEQIKDEIEKIKEGQQQVNEAEQQIKEDQEISLQNNTKSRIPQIKEFPLVPQSPLSQSSILISSSDDVSTLSSRITPKSLFHVTLLLLFVGSLIFLVYTFFLTPKKRREIRVWSSAVVQKFQNSSNRRRVDFQV